MIGEESADPLNIVFRYGPTQTAGCLKPEGETKSINQSRSTALLMVLKGCML